MSTPIADFAPFSTAYRQCQPNPHPKSRTSFLVKSGNIFLKTYHSPAPSNPFCERFILLYFSKKAKSSYLFSFIVFSPGSWSFKIYYCQFNLPLPILIYRAIVLNVLFIPVFHLVSSF